MLNTIGDLVQGLWGILVEMSKLKKSADATDKEIYNESMAVLAEALSALKGNVGPAITAALSAQNASNG